jgi:hypothetical protein
VPDRILQRWLLVVGTTAGREELSLVRPRRAGRASNYLFKWIS